MPSLQLSFASGDHGLQVRRFSVHEGLGVPFTAAVWARSPEAGIDLEALIGDDAPLKIDDGAGATRVWSGVLRLAHLGRVEAEGLSSYLVHIVPKLMLL